MDLKDLYSTQVRLLWEWRGGRRALLKRLVITLVVATISFAAHRLVAAGRQYGPACSTRSSSSSSWRSSTPSSGRSCSRFVAPRSLILTAIMVLVLQVLVFMVAANIVPGVHVGGFLPALIGSFVYAIINTVLTAILGVDSGGSFYGLLVQQLLVEGRRGQDRQARARDHPDRRPRPPDPGRADARRLGQHDGRLGPRRQPQAVALGGDPAVDDVGAARPASSTATTTGSRPSAGTSATAST